MEQFILFNLGKIFEKLANNFDDGRDFAFMRMTTKLTEVWEQNTEISEKLDERNHDIIGRVLKFHLKTEYYLNKIIEDLGNSFIPREIRDGMYFGKIEKLKEVFVNDTAFLNLAEILIEINKIRNKYAHNINFKIKPENIPNILDFANISTVPQEEEQLIKIIENSVSTICTWLPLYFGNTKIEFLKVFYENINKDLNDI